MILNGLKLHNFRNYGDESFTFDPAVNLILGENAQGKTNLLEAIAALSTTRLFRTGQKKEGVRLGETNAVIQGDFVTENIEINLEMRISREKTTEIWKNGARLRRLSDAQGLLKTVLFCPDDLSLIRAGAAARRKFLDTALCQLRPGYATALAEYERVLAHKIRILRDSEEHPAMLDLLDDFTLRLCRLGALLIRYRARYAGTLGERAGEIHAEAAPGEVLEVGYDTVSTVADPLAPCEVIEAALREHAQSHRAAEIAARSALSGCHKDDLSILLNGLPAAAYGSQGQVRTAALALKLAERDMFYRADGEYPLLLLDDVLSELDRKRQDFVLNRLGDGQVFITCCEDEAAPRFGAGRVFRIAAGRAV